LLRSSERRGSCAKLIGGFERRPAPVQKAAEQIEPRDRQNELARDRVAVSVQELALLIALRLPIKHGRRIVLNID
jgi:hypothetical protein